MTQAPASSASASSPAPSAPPAAEPRNAEPRNAEPLNAEPLNAEPLNYTTTSRPPLPQYDGQNLRPRRTAEAPGLADLPPTEALPSQDIPSYRPKDYSPEGRRSVTPNWAPSYDGTVDFQTQNRDEVLAGASSHTYVPEVPVAEGEHTMTRRELRALREAEGTTADPTDQAPLVEPYPTVAPASVAPVAPAFIAPSPEPVNLIAPPPLVPPAPQASTRLDSALAEFDALAAGREPVLPAPDSPAPLPGRRAAQQPQEPLAQAPLVQAPLAQEPLAQEPVAEVPVVQQPQVPLAPAPVAQQPQDSLSTFEALFADQSVAQPVAEPVAAEEPAASAAAQLLAPPVTPPVVPAASESDLAPTWTLDPLLSAPAPQGAPALAPPPANSPAPAPSLTSTPSGPASGPTSVGHWSTQSDIDDAEQVIETTISRSVGAGSGAITTSALVLPSVPTGSISGPMSGNGEILLTGSISLPHSLSATGAHPSQLDESDMDHLLDPGDLQVTNTGSMPVRAIRAVSTNTASGSIIAPTKQAGARGFTILIIAASVMAVVVVGLLVAGFVSGTL
ncbi:MAG: hypothetical protein ABIS08_02485 [Pseudolysinimonas sp.]